MNIAICVLTLALQTAVPRPDQQIIPAPKPAVTAESAELGKKLLQVRRIYVDSFGDDAVAKQIQAMVVSSLSETKRFIITENKDKADAILRGTALEKSSQEFHSFPKVRPLGPLLAVSAKWGTSRLEEFMPHTLLHRTRMHGQKRSIMPGSRCDWLQQTAM